MKKLLKILAVLFLLGLIALVAVGFFIGPIIKKTVNTVGPKITGTRVELDDAKVMLFTGGGELAGLFVGNPEGWTEEKAFYLGKIKASVRPGSLLGDVIEVNEVHIDAPEFVYERRLLGGSNIDALLAQIDKNTGGGTQTPGAEPGEPATPSSAEKKFIVKSFKLEGAKVTLIGVGQGVTLTLPPLTFTDLGVKEGGLTADQIATVALRQVLARIGVAVADSLGQSLLDGGAKGGDATKAAAKNALDALLGKQPSSGATTTK